MSEMSDPDDADEALDWAVRTSDPAFDDWAAFAAWLDGDPRRNDRYEAVMVAAADGAQAAAAAAANGPAPYVARGDRRRVRRSPRRMLAGGGAVVAAASAAALVLFLRPPSAPDAVPSPSLLVETPAGQARRIALADGSRIDVAGGSRLLVAHAGARRVTIERGRALFTVRHDAALPFVVMAGRHEVRDLGTVFEVARAATGVRVSVAEGAVVVDPGPAPLPLAPGQRAELDDATGGRRVTRVPAARIGAWRQANLSYRDAALVDVADDLSGALGVAVKVAPRLAARRFTGALTPDSLRDRPQALGAILDVSVRTGPQGWELHPR